MHAIEILIVAALTVDFHLSRALFLTNLSVPRLIDAAQKAKLFCSYEMGNRTLNSVKWYKDGHEFFRYSPLTPPTTNWFPVAGITVAQGSSHCNQFICNLELERLTTHSSGAYRCEVSGDAPEFKLIDKTANMTVGVLPKFGPYISGVVRQYKYGDYLSANCSSEWSNPHATLTWYINNKTTSTSTLQSPIRETSRNSEGFTLYSTVLQLRLQIDDPRFITSSEFLDLKCVADIMGIVALRRQSQMRATILALKDAGHKQRLMGGGTTSRAVAGVTIAQGSSHCNQFICNLELERLTTHSSGAYRCEVSGDAPEFKLIDKTANMTVGVLPKFGPYISGVVRQYKYGDYLSANCSSEWSNPHATLTWYINNKTTSTSTLQSPIRETSRNSEGFTLYSTVLQLRLQIDDPRFITSSEFLDLKCVADIMGIVALRRQSQMRATILALKDAGHKQRLMGGGTTSRADGRNAKIPVWLLFVVFIGLRSPRHHLRDERVIITFWDCR